MWYNFEDSKKGSSWQSNICKYNNFQEQKMKPTSVKLDDDFSSVKPHHNPSCDYEDYA